MAWRVGLAPEGMCLQLPGWLPAALTTRGLPCCLVLPAVYSQLANVITQLFFPSTNPVVAQLSFWGVYAVGFLSRPAGAILFG